VGKSLRNRKKASSHIAKSKSLLVRIFPQVYLLCEFLNYQGNRDLQSMQNASPMPCKKTRRVSVARGRSPHVTQCQDGSSSEHEHLKCQRQISTYFAWKRNSIQLIDSILDSHYCLHEHRVRKFSAMLRGWCSRLGQPAIPTKVGAICTNHGLLAHAHVGPANTRRSHNGPLARPKQSNSRFTILK